jgi:uncharacterized protein (TIGR02145 family)
MIKLLNKVIMSIMLLISIISIDAKSQSLEEYIDKSNGNTYNTVQIGRQIWMTENLDVDRFRNGDIIPQAKNNYDWNVANNKKLPICRYYDDDSFQNKVYGKLYNWYAVNDPRGLAPKGWRIPKDEDWLILNRSFDGESGIHLRSPGGWLEGFKYGAGRIINDNSSGFSALPSGEFGFTFGGSFTGIGEYAIWWCINSHPAQPLVSAYTCTLRNDYSGISIAGSGKNHGLSVRCIKD